jgi:hypothetical protein
MFAELCGEIRDALVPCIGRLFAKYNSSDEITAAVATVFFNEAVRFSIEKGLTRAQIENIVSEHATDILEELRAANLWRVVSSAEDNRSRRVRRPNR